MVAKMVRNWVGNLVALMDILKEKQLEIELGT